MLLLSLASERYEYSGTKTRKRRKKPKAIRKRRVLWGVLAGVFVLCLGAAVTLLLMYSGIRARCVVELGSPIPAADAFSDGAASVSYITDMSSVDIAVPGDHWIHVSADGKDRIVMLSIRDTIAPQAQPVELDISVGQQVTPDQLVSNLTDAGSVRLQWDEAPVFGTAGDYPVVITMRDMSGNTASVASLVHIRAVKESVSCEAGADPPALTDFLVDAGLDASFVTDIASLPLRIPGEYGVEIKINEIVYASRLVVTDTVAPQVTLKTVFIEPGASASPEDFITSAVDESPLTYEFEREPDYSLIGVQDVTVRTTDMGGNTVSQSAKLLISRVAPVTVEARDSALTAEDFDVAGFADVSVVTHLIPNVPGDHYVELVLDGQTNPCIVTVADTTSPRGEGVDAHWYLSHPIAASRLVSNEFDYTGITYAFATEPDWTKPEEQRVSVVLTDAAGNTTTVTSTLTLVADTEAPKLYGVMNRYCYIGQAVAYFAEVFAVDNCDEEVAVDVDKSQVDIYAAGTYPVTYTATDSSGNSVQISCKFTFIEETITDEKLNAAADEVLAGITTPDMSIGRKAYAIYQYVFTHIRYNGVGGHSDWKYEAYRGITSGRGDCFTFYSTAKCLLERIGAETMGVHRHGGKGTPHYWLLVNLGTGWYHFDAINVGPKNFECFMRTTKAVLTRSTYFWSFDQSLYPPTPTEEYVLE
jgi:hypothetical protein